MYSSDLSSTTITLNQLNRLHYYDLQLETALCYQHYFCNTELKITTETNKRTFDLDTTRTRLYYFALFKLTLGECKTLTKISTCKTSHNHSANSKLWQKAPCKLLGRCVLLGAGFVLLPPGGLDLLLLIRLCISFLMCAKDVACTREGVSDWRAILTLIAIKGHLAIAQDLSFTLMGLCILIFMGSILLCVGGFRFAAGFLAAISGLRLGRA